MSEFKGWLLESLFMFPVLQNSKMKMTSQKRQFDVYLYLLCIKFEPKGESVFIDV